MKINNFDFNDYKQLLNGGSTSDYTLFFDCCDNFINIGESLNQIFRFSFASDIIDNLTITYSQKDRVLVIKDLYDVKFVTENIISYDLSQDETLRFEQGKAFVQISIKLKDGEIINSEIYRLKVVGSLKNKKLGNNSVEQYAIQGIVNDQVIELLPLIKIVSGTENIYRSKFIFDSTWDNTLNKKAVFKDEYNNYIEVELYSNECLIPNKVLENCGKIHVRIVGYIPTNSEEYGYTKPTTWSNSVRVYK